MGDLSAFERWRIATLTLAKLEAMGRFGVPAAALREQIIMPPVTLATVHVLPVAFDPYPDGEDEMCGATDPEMAEPSCGYVLDHVSPHEWEPV